MPCNFLTNTLPHVHRTCQLTQSKRTKLGLEQASPGMTCGTILFIEGEYRVKVRAWCMHEGWCRLAAVHQLAGRQDNDIAGHDLPMSKFSYSPGDTVSPASSLTRLGNEACQTRFYTCLCSQSHWFSWFCLFGWSAERTNGVSTGCHSCTSHFPK